MSSPALPRAPGALIARLPRAMTRRTCRVCGQERILHVLAFGVAVAHMRAQGAPVDPDDFQNLHPYGNHVVSPRHQLALEQLALDTWCAPIGTEVVVSLVDDQTYRTRTRSMPRRLDDGRPAVFVEGIEPPCSLARVFVLTAEQLALELTGTLNVAEIIPRPHERLINGRAIEARLLESRLTPATMPAAPIIPPGYGPRPPKAPAKSKRAPVVAPDLLATPQVKRRRGRPRKSETTAPAPADARSESRS